MNRNLLITAALLLTVASGILHGYMTQRWGIDDRMQRSAQALSELPSDVGDWQLLQKNELSESAMEMLQCAGYINHIYRNRTTDRRVHVTVLVGPGATIAIHRPEICYESRNYSVLGSKRKIETTDEVEHVQRLWAVDFQTNDINKQKMRVYYTWSNGQEWTAPNRPRLAFAGERVLYKLQIAEANPGESEDASLQFLHLFLPMLQKHINSPDGA